MAEPTIEEQIAWMENEIKMGFGRLGDARHRAMECAQAALTTLRARSAAPEMLEALKIATRSLEALATEESFPIVGTALIPISAAIAKATGETS